MTLRTSLYLSIASLVVAGSAWGQSTGPGVEAVVGYQGLPARTASGSQSGIQVTDGTMMHVGIGAEAGYDSNVFYGETNVKGSPIIRVVPFVGFTNETRTGAIPSGLYFDLGAALTYREYLSDDPVIREQRAFMPSAYGKLEFGRGQTMTFGLSEAFSRTEDPPYLNVPNQESIIRDVNLASASVRWAPGGGRLAGALSYTNTIDAFETNALSIANSMGHLLVLDTTWKWLPKTALVLQLSQGYISYFNTDPTTGLSKPSSFPFHALAGIRGLITAKLMVNIGLGYANGFYDLPNRSGPSGFRGNFSATADVIYRPTVLTTTSVGYRHDFQNAILGDFYYLDAVYANLSQAIAGRLGLGLSVRYESRSFQNIYLASSNTYISRHDNYWQAGANLDYHLRDWTYVGVAYSIMSNQSDYHPLASDDPGRVNYVKQLFFARLGITY